jgi:hypothetical protein
MRHIPTWTTALFAMVLAACDGGSAPPATVARASAEPTTLSQGSGPVVQSATGAGHFTVGGDLRTFSFTALKYADGTVQGQYELFSRSAGTRIHGDVVCLSVVGNHAWVGGSQDHSIDDVAFPPGLENGFQTVDNGEGTSDPPDQLSLMFINAPAGFAQAYCDAQADAPPLNDIEGGNIQVH